MNKIVELATVTTKDLVDELLRRTDVVEGLFIEPLDKCEVAVMHGDGYLTGGMHEVNNGPFLLLRIID